MVTHKGSEFLRQIIHTGERAHGQSASGKQGGYTALVGIRQERTEYVTWTHQCITFPCPP